MTPERQLAESVKYSSALVWSFAEISPGTFALYNHARQVQLIATDFLAILAAYRARPAYVSPSRPSPSIAGIDTSKLEFRI